MSKLVALLFLLACAPFSRADDGSSEQQDANKLLAHIEELRQYAAAQNSSTDIAILIDMSIPSWKNRFFVVNLKTNEVLLAGLCGHGQGNDYQSENVVFSNKNGSLCTSEGKYKIGDKYKGEWGTSYRLHGLEATNSNAFARFIVFHAHPKVPDVEDKPACRSYGCPMVSATVFAAASKLLDASDKPVLMWIYK